MNRNKRIAIAYETLDILETGQYLNQHRETVHLGDDLQSSVANTVLYKPDDFTAVFSQRDKLLSSFTGEPPQISVTGETTFAAAHRLIVKEGIKDVCCLNFASAKNPGGGFLGGAQAQEEALARASGLYASLKTKQEMYDFNRQHSNLLYTDQMIFSPRVPVFRDDHDHLLDIPYYVSILTSPAVNAGALRNNDPERVKDMPAVMLARIEKLLSVAVIQGQTTLILGAWGCGVFRNDPNDVADWFAQQLLHNDIFKNAFRHIVFAVYDSSDKQVNRKAFDQKFAPYVVR
ncbi:TIGR02452 family protein [Chitinophaga arvensicola]|uniref:TIGR02452 family protein n=1 Tax=Chitinophaga arvensicola TaxID=29529 RepID=A0A1I0S6H9_9BACT|nr:TIGR02452 family protein [Chitinophaga arvensicola]SEW50982.1 TIGR02452 family protein [Chitinophaga arvensicola]